MLNRTDADDDREECEKRIPPDGRRECSDSIDDCHRARVYGKRAKGDKGKRGHALESEKNPRRCGTKEC